MKIVRCQDPAGMGEKAHQWCGEKVAAAKAQSIYVPAGNTPKALYALWEKHHPAYLRGQRLIQIDDVEGANRPFRQFLLDHLPSYTDQLVELSDAPVQADLAILGFGLNGHVAFHEPGLPADFRYGRVPLSEKTKETQGLKGEAWGISYGAGSFYQCKAILLIVWGLGKAPAYQGFLNGDAMIPASFLRNHPDLTVFLQDGI